MAEDTTQTGTSPSSQRNITGLGWLVALGAVFAVLVLVNSSIASYRYALIDQKVATLQSENTTTTLRNQLAGIRQELAEIKTTLRPSESE